MRVSGKVWVLTLLLQWVFPANAAERGVEAPVVIQCGGAIIASSNTTLLSLRIDRAEERCNVSVNGASTGLPGDRYIEALQSVRSSLAYGKLSPWELMEFLPFFLAASADAESEAEKLLEVWHGDPESRWKGVRDLEKCFNAARSDTDINLRNADEMIACRSFVPYHSVRVIEISLPSPLDMDIEYRFVIPMPQVSF